MAFKPPKTELFLALMLLGFLSVLYQKFFLLPPLSADSWSYFEISKTIFSDFYRFSTFRSYENASAYGSSFPPLWPFLISVFNFIFDQGPRAGFLINIVLLPFICLSSERLTRDLTGFKFLGIILFGVILSDVSLIDEAIGGRTIPLQILLLLNLFGLLISKNDGSKGVKHAQCGALVGLCLMNRFDAMALVPAVFLFLIFMKSKIRDFSIFSVVLLVFISPWVCYSLKHFRSFWKTDNSFVAKAVNKAYVTDFYPSQIMTLKEDLGAWLLRVLGNVQPLYNAYWEGLWDLSLSLAVFAGLFVIGYGVQKFVLKSKDGWQNVSVNSFNSRIYLRAIILFLLFKVFSLGPCLLTGYMDLRYFIFIRLILILILCGGIGMFLARWANVQKLLSSSVFLVVPVLLFLAVSKFPKVEAVDVADGDPINGSWIRELDTCLKAQKNVQVTFFPKIVFFPSAFNAFQFGAMSGNRSACLPENFWSLSVEDRRKFIESFGISHVVSSKDLNLLSSELGLGLKIVECSPVIFEIVKVDR